MPFNNKFKNYTKYIGDPLRFVNNSLNVNLGILILRILDLIMQRPDNKRLNPLPACKKDILMNKHYIAAFS